MLNNMPTENRRVVLTPQLVVKSSVMTLRPSPPAVQRAVEKTPYKRMVDDPKIAKDGRHR
jgi:hypothetical protein